MKEVVLVASKNPVKVEAVREGFQKVFPHKEYDFLSVDAPSGVSDQPVGIPETLRGARNRVDHLLSANGQAAYYAGIEGGVEEHDGELFAFAWVVIRSREGIVSKAQTGHFPLPPRVKTLLDQGFELGHATDKVFGLHNSKQDMGAVGVLTDQLIDRKAYYVHAVVLALIPYLKPILFSVK